MKNLILLLVILSLVSCSSVKVTYNLDRGVDFTEFKTFSLYPWDTYQDKVVNDYDKQTILMSIKSEMIQRGYQFVEKGGDLMVSPFVIVSKETSYQSYTNHYGGWAGYGGGWGYGAGMGYYGYGMGPGYATTTVSKTDYLAGTMIIDIFRLDGKKLIWQGVAKGEVTQDLAKRDKRLPLVIKEIFSNYPVSPKKK